MNQWLFARRYVTSLACVCQSRFLQCVASIDALAQLKALSSLDRVRVVVTCRNSAFLVTEDAADGFNVLNYPV